MSRYNVFSSHGPDLYGTEPASFYLLNGLLNFNLVFPAALAVLPLRGLASLVLGHRQGQIFYQIFDFFSLPKC